MTTSGSSETYYHLEKNLYTSPQSWSRVFETQRNYDHIEDLLADNDWYREWLHSAKSGQDRGHYVYRIVKTTTQLVTNTEVIL